jgi:hypothetical protein
MLNTMWSFGKEPEPRDCPPSSAVKYNKIKARARLRLKGKGSDAAAKSFDSSAAPLSFAFSEETLSVSETTHGVEVALDWSVLASQICPKVSVVNYVHHARQGKKIHKCQFSMNYPALPLAAKGGSRRQPQQQSRHRIPLSEDGTQPPASLQDHIFMLQSHFVRDELTSVEEEAVRLDAEIQALEDDRMELEHQYLQLPSNHAEAPTWDMDFLLKQQKSSLADVKELQRLRGRCWTVQLESMKTRDSLLASLLPIDLPGNKRNNKYKSRTTVTAATQVSHLCLLPGGNNHNSSFYLHTDSSESHGHIPPRLLARMKKHALQKEFLTYLATGPNGTYYCSFSTGNVWWGISDPDFEAVVKEWPVHRVAFGEAKKLPKQKRLFSWIVVSRDGRVAFKNLPLRLTNLLSSRLADESAPAEISLGSEGAYFIRFLNGFIDYCLPSHVTEVCNYIEKRGGMITNVLLHPQLSKEFIIRHTEIK